MTSKDWPRLAISALIMALLTYAAIMHYSPGIEEIIKALALLVAGYWVGSSKSSADKSAELSKQASETQDVRVANSPDDPAHVEEVQ